MQIKTPIDFIKGKIFLILQFLTTIIVYSVGCSKLIEENKDDIVKDIKNLPGFYVFPMMSRINDS